MRTVSPVGVVLLCVFVLALPQPGPAAASPDLVAGIKTQLKTAIFQSSELAAQDSSVAAIKLYLHHTINCLEGPTGMQFKVAVDYPCRGQGSGIIPDLQAAVSRGVPGAQRALEDATVAWALAVKAMGMTDVNEAQPWAQVVAKYLKMASDDLGK